MNRLCSLLLTSLFFVFSSSVGCSSGTAITPEPDADSNTYPEQDTFETGSDDASPDAESDTDLESDADTIEDADATPDAEVAEDSDIDVMDAGPCSEGEWVGNFEAYSQEELDRLRGYTSVSGFVIIRSEIEPIDLSALECLNRCRSFFLEHNMLTNLDGLENLRTIRNLGITNNEALTNIDGLSGLTSVEGNITIRFNSVFPSCRADSLIDRLREAGWEGTVRVSDNDDLATCP